MKDDRLYLTHIAECIERIREYTAVGKAEFISSRLRQDAVAHNFEIIGEASSRVSKATRDRSTVPWGQMKGFRNFLIHQYSGVDEHVVWKIASEDIPVLAEQIDELLKRFDHS